MKYNLSDNIDRQKAKTRFEVLLINEKNIELKEVRKPRTVKQNAYLHVIITLFGIETGLTIEESKTFLKRKCNFMMYEKNGEFYLKKTAGMDTLEMTKFIDWIRNFSSLQGCYIPTADEYLENKFRIDSEIERNQEFL